MLQARAKIHRLDAVTCQLTSLANGFIWLVCWVRWALFLSGGVLVVHNIAELNNLRFAECADTSMTRCEAILGRFAVSSLKPKLASTPVGKARDHLFDLG